MFSKEMILETEAQILRKMEMKNYWIFNAKIRIHIDKKLENQARIAIYNERWKKKFVVETVDEQKSQVQLQIWKR